MNQKPRRQFLRQSLWLGAASLLAPQFLASCDKDPGSNENGSKKDKPLSKPWFDISLAAYSLHRAFESNDLVNRNFAQMAKEEFGISAIEFLNTYFKDKAKDHAYLEDLNKTSKDLGVKHLLIMIDGEGELGTPSERSRKEAVLNHFKWVEAAAALGCHSIRVNAGGEGTAEQVKEAALDGLSQLGKYAIDFNINVIVENHGGYSSDGKWLSSLIKLVDMENVGTLPDFGNFCIEGRPQGKGVCDLPYDRYMGVEELLPYAKGVSAKTYTFDEKGNETTIDYQKMMEVVYQSGYRGHVGIEYEGDKLSENEGIKATKKLLEKYSLIDFGRKQTTPNPQDS